MDFVHSVAESGRARETTSTSASRRESEMDAGDDLAEKLRRARKRGLANRSPTFRQ